MIRTETDAWRFAYVCRAAMQLNARRDLAEALIERLTDEKLRGIPLQELIVLVVEGQSHRYLITPEGLIAMQAAWREWIAQHGEEIDAGKKFKPGDKNLPRTLFGTFDQLPLPDGSHWPAE